MGEYDPIVSSGNLPLPPANFVGSGVFKVIENGTITQITPNVTVKPNDLIFYVFGQYFPMSSPTTTNPSVAHAVFITDVVPLGSGSVYNKVPANDVVTDFETTAVGITIHFLALAGAAFTPVVTLGGSPPDTFNKISGVAQWEGTFDVPAVNSQPYTLDHDNGSSFTANAVVAAQPVLTLTINNATLPVGQTHLKAGDQFDVDWTSSEDLDSINVEDQQACIEQSYSVSGTAGTITVTVAARADTITNTEFLAQNVVARGTADTGSVSDYTNSTNTVDLLNYYPQLTIDSTVFSDASGALNSVNTATVNNTITANGAYTIVYDDDGTNDLTITNPNTFEAAKLVQMSGTTSLNTTINNFQITATQDKNGAETSIISLIPITDVAPVLTISNLPLEMRSGGSHGSSAQVYTMRVTSDQDLTALDISADIGFVGAFAQVGGDPSIWEANYTIDETAVTFGQGQITFSIVSAPNASAIDAVVLNGETDYAIKGFVNRFVPLGAEIGSPSGVAFARHGSIGETQSVSISNTANLILKDIGGAVETYINSLTTPTEDNYSIVDWSGSPTLNPTDGDYLYWLDSDANSNFAGAYLIQIEETV